jgi:hypothetical protein
MLKKTAFLSLFAILVLAGAASARPGCPHQVCHDPHPPISGGPAPTPTPTPEPERLPPVSSDCIDADGDGEEDDECQSVEGFMDPGAGATGGIGVRW